MWQLDGETRSVENLLREERTKFLPDPSGTIEAATAVEEELNPRLERLATWCQAAEEAAQRLSEVSAEREALTRAGVALEEAAAEASGISEKLSSLTGLATQYEAEEEALLFERADARVAYEEARRRLETLLDGDKDPDELSCAHQRALALPGMLRDLRALSDGLARRKQELKDNQEALSLAISKHESAEREADSHRNERDRAREREGATRNVAARLARDTNELRRTRAGLERGRTDLVRAEEALGEAQKSADDLATAYQEAERLYLEQVRAESGLQAAVMAHPGEPCPVCEREIPEGFRGPSEGDVEREERLLRDAREVMERSRNELDQAMGQVRIYEERAANLRAAQKRLADEEEEAWEGLRQDVGELLEWGALLEATNPEEVDAEEVTLQVRRELEEAEAAFVEASRGESEARGKRERIAGEVSGTEERIQEERRRLERGERECYAALASLPAFAAVRPEAWGEGLRALSE